MMVQIPLKIEVAIQRNSQIILQDLKAQKYNILPP